MPQLQDGEQQRQARAAPRARKHLGCAEGRQDHDGPYTQQVPTGCMQHVVHIGVACYVHAKHMV